MKAKVIKTESEYSAALARLEKLMEARAGTPQGDELELLALLIHDYEDKVFPSPGPTRSRPSVFAWSSRDWPPKIWRPTWAAAAGFRKFCRDGGA